MLRLIILIIIALLVLSFFGISIRGIIESPTGQENFAYAWELIVLAAQWIWNLIVEAFDFITFWNN